MLRAPTGRVAGAAGRIGESDICAVATANTVVWPEGDALEHAGWTSWQNALKSRVLAGVTRHHNSLHIMSWMFFIEVHTDDLHGTGPRPALDLVQTNLSQKIRFKIWTVYEVGMRYEHLKRERLLHDDRTQIVPNPKKTEDSVAQHGPNELQTSTNAERSWIRQTET